MYILYESYDDDCKHLKELETNTKIINIYEDKEVALADLKSLVDNTITLEDTENDWFVKEIVLDNKNIIGAYQVFNNGIDSYQNYMIILERKEDIKDGKENY